MSKADVQTPRGLPEPLPEGEQILWQQSPLWRPYGRRVFQLDKVAIYFLLVVGWVAVSAFLGGGWPAAMRSLIWALPPEILSRILGAE